MTYKTMVTPISYQPTLPDPAITLQSYYRSNAYIIITQNVHDTTTFYALDSDPFQEVIGLPLLVPQGTTVRSYSAKVGSNDSNIVSYLVPTP